MSEKEMLETQAAEAAQKKIPTALLALVKRTGSDKDGKPTEKAIAPKEVFAWKEYEDRVVVVTTDGQKFSGAKSAR